MAGRAARDYLPTVAVNSGLTRAVHTVFNERMDALQKAIDAVGTQAELAKRLDVSDMAVSQWKKRGVPPERCRAIEDATDGAVSRYELRPDIFGPAPKAEAA